MVVLITLTYEDMQCPIINSSSLCSWHFLVLIYACAFPHALSACWSLVTLKTWNTSIIVKLLNSIEILPTLIFSQPLWIVIDLRKIRLTHIRQSFICLALLQLRETRVTLNSTTFRYQLAIYLFLGVNNHKDKKKKNGLNLAKIYIV